MFKKEINSAQRQKLKTSVQRSLRQSLLATYPLLVPYADEVLPRKASLLSVKLPDRAVLYVLGDEPLFFETGKPGSDVPLLPHLRLVHRFPQAFPSIRIDRGAIRYVLGGATLMAPGLTSAGGRLPAPRTLPPGPDGAPASPAEAADAEGRWSRELARGEPVVITAEGKQEACAVGLLVAGTQEVKDKGKGPVVEEAHFLGDGLWRVELN